MNKNGEFDRSSAQQVIEVQAQMQRRPDDPQLLMKVAELVHKKGSLLLAVAYVQQALGIDPNNASFHERGGTWLCQIGRQDEGLFHLRRAITLAPANYDFRISLANALVGLNEIDLAIVQFKQAQSLSPRSPKALVALAEAFSHKGDFEQAVTFAKKALRHRDGSTTAHLVLARALSQLGDFDRAAHEARNEIRHDAIGARYVLASILCDANRVAEAAALCREILGSRPEMPDVHFLLAWCLLAGQDYRYGWAEYEWRLKLPGHSLDAGKFRTPLTEPMWKGEPLNRKVVLVHCEQGFGDSLFFIRYAKLLAERGATIMVLAQQPLVDLFALIPHIHKVIPYGDLVPRYDYHIVIGSLPSILTRQVEDIPREAQYIPAPKSVPASGFIRSKEKLNVGVVWGGNHLGSRDRRAIDPRYLKQIFGIEGADYYNLQVGLRGSEFEKFASYTNVFDASTLIGAFDSTARILSDLDLLVSVDTALAHLAGALGKRVFTLLPFSADWRWFRNDRSSSFYTRSPWYPTMTLFRQTSFGVWGPVVKSVMYAVSEEVQRKNGDAAGDHLHICTEVSEARRRVREAPKSVF